MVVISGHKEFDRQANASIISTGNVWAGTQFSNHIRPFSQAECNGRVCEPGELQKFDLDHWKHRRLPSCIKNWFKSRDKNEAVILYEFFHYNGSRRQVHGYVITRDRSENYELLHSFVANSTHKSRLVVEEMIKHVSGLNEVAAA